MIPCRPWALWDHSTLVGATGSALETILRPPKQAKMPQKTKHDKKDQKWLPTTLYLEMSDGFWVHMHDEREESHMGSKIKLSSILEDDI